VNSRLRSPCGQGRTASTSAGCRSQRRRRRGWKRSSAWSTPGARSTAASRSPPLLLGGAPFVDGSTCPSLRSQPPHEDWGQAWPGRAVGRGAASLLARGRGRGLRECLDVRPSHAGRWPNHVRGDRAAGGDGRGDRAGPHRLPRPCPWHATDRDAGGVPGHDRCSVGWSSRDRARRGERLRPSTSRRSACATRLGRSGWRDMLPPSSD
jgi:hypothetical protein